MSQRLSRIGLQQKKSAPRTAMINTMSMVTPLLIYNLSYWSQCRTSQSRKGSQWYLYCV